VRSSSQEDGHTAIPWQPSSLTLADGMAWHGMAMRPDQSSETVGYRRDVAWLGWRIRS